MIKNNLLMGAAMKGGHQSHYVLTGRKGSTSSPSPFCDFGFLKLVQSFFCETWFGFCFTETSFSLFLFFGASIIQNPSPKACLKPILLSSNKVVLKKPSQPSPSTSFIFPWTNVF